MPRTYGVIPAVSAILLAGFGCGSGPVESVTAPPEPAGPIRLVDPPIPDVTIADSVWAPRVEVNRTRTLEHVWEELEHEGNIANFEIAGGAAKGEFGGPYWADSDVYKWLQAASYHLATRPDPALEERVDGLIAKIAAAQRPDGYIDTYVQIVDPGARWANLGFYHEMFSGGSLIEAGVAHFEATGKRSLLDVATRYADYVDSVFGEGPGKRRGTSGHEEIELALMDLHRLTNEPRYLRLAQYFLDERGRKPSVFQLEYDRLPANKQVDFLGRMIPMRGLHDRFYRADPNVFDTRYCQDHLPVREQSDAVGHAVRAMYLYAAMAEVVHETGDEGMMNALLRLHDSVALRRMYVTGGIGPSADNEGFDKDYDLPNESAYQETCATVGLALWNHRMLKLTGDGRYADLMELALYNSFLGGVSLEGATFCYVNPMKASEKFERRPWFTVPCCPTTAVRTFPRMGTYVYSRSEDGVWVNLYVAGGLKTKVGGEEVEIRQSGDYPWEGAARVEVTAAQPTEFTLRLRIPGWANGHSLTLNGRRIEAPVRLGYALIHRAWSSGDAVELDLPMEIERLAANPAVAADRGKLALRRGPLVYALEQVDHDVDIDRILLSPDAPLTSRFDPDLLGGVVVIEGRGEARDEAAWEGKLYQPLGALAAGSREPAAIKAVPYGYWGNRGATKMTVWVDAPR